MTISEVETSSKVLATHRYRSAVVYVRQSTPGQVEHNTESTDRQYALAERAVRLGWPRDAVRIIDADLGRSGASTAGRSGFAELTTLVGLGQVGIVLALEVSRLARNNSDWYRLLDLAGMTNTLLADADGVYHPGLFNDRMLLGLKGTMSEAELHVLRARLDGGIRNKAQRGELRRGLPVGLVWGEDEGQILLHPDEAVTGVITAVFARFAACGSVRGTWLWLREQQLKWPLQPAAGATSPAPQVIWVEPTYHAVHTTLTHPAYAGAYVYGRTRAEKYVTGDGDLRTRRRRIGRDDWEVCIPDHHQGFLDWDDYLANQQRIGRNIRPTAHQPGTGAVREGCALLQGLATCGTCGRKLAVYYDGRHRNTPGYYCTGTGHLIDGKNLRHLRIGGVAIDAAVGQAFLAAMAGDAVTACLAAARELQDGHHSVLEQHRREVQRARYDATRAERRYLAVDAENRLVARGLEAAWEKALTALAAAEAELARREARQPKTLTAEQQSRILALGTDLGVIWSARDHHRSGPQGTPGHPAHRGHHHPGPGRRPRRPRAPLEGRRPHRSAGAAHRPETGPAPHRRGHHRPRPPAGRALPRRPDRRHPQPAKAFHRNRTALHRRTITKTAAPLEHPLPPTRRPHQPEQRSTIHHRRRRRGTEAPTPDPAPLDQRRLHHRRTTHPRRAVADPPHRRDPGAVHRRRTRRVAGDARSHPRPRAVPQRLTVGCHRTSGNRAANWRYIATAIRHHPLHSLVAVVVGRSIRSEPSRSVATMV